MRYFLSNKKGLIADGFGEFEDWIELYNPSDSDSISQLVGDVYNQ